MGFLMGLVLGALLGAAGILGVAWFMFEWTKRVRQRGTGSTVLNGESVCAVVRSDDGPSLTVRSMA